jgi:hypothetical protein
MEVYGMENVRYSELAETSTLRRRDVALQPDGNAMQRASQVARATFVIESPSLLPLPFALRFHEPGSGVILIPWGRAVHTRNR